MLRFSRWVVAALCAAVHASAVTVHAQWQSNTGPSGAALGAVVGGDVERYVRALVLAGLVKPVAWGARPFGPAELSELLRDTSRGAHPWKEGMQKALAPRASLGGALFASVNTGFPWGANDGAMWQGRGLTTAVGGAATFRWGPVTAVAAPVVFWAQNASFPILRPPVVGVSPYSDPQYPVEIDLPQRMSARQYARVDGGESSIRIRARGVEVGLTTASEGWGTGEVFPAILGANAGGFPHLFVATNGRGLHIPLVGRVSGRYILGTLQQSDYSPVHGSDTFVDATQSGTTRIGTGISVSLMPDFIPDLELGASRFFHSPYRSGSSKWSPWSRPFEGIFKKGLNTAAAGDPAGDADNQLGAFFARWTLPKRGVEATLELLRDDHNWDSRDLAEEPENNSAVLASVRGVTQKRGDKLAVLTMEYFDGDVRPIGQVRAQGFLYVHGVLIQGHTQRGQLLGSPIGDGAITGARVAWEQFTPTGSLRFNLQRWRTRSLRTQDNQGLYPAAPAPIAYSHDWILDGSVAQTRYRGSRAVTLEGGIAWAGIWQFGDGATNLYARAAWSIF